MNSRNKISKARSTSLNTKNRFEELYIDYNDENIEQDDEVKKTETRFYNDFSKSILAKNESPDLGFDYSINPYRGCEHGCIYCYARPTHEYLGFSAGLDFESKIMVKRDAPELLEKAFLKKSWKPQPIMLSGNTDCYQPVERKLRITREILKVCLKFRNPASIITKNALIQRDLDILKQLAELNLVSVTISITSLSRELSRKLEPRTSVPSKRFETVKLFSDNNIPVGVNLAPIIPGLNDEEIPALIKASSEAGALWAGRTILRLPWAVKELFLEWLHRNLPEKESKILNRIKDTRGGKLSNHDFGTRLAGEGEIASAIHKLFKMNCKKYDLNNIHIKLRNDLFTREHTGQTDLFT